MKPRLILPLVAAFVLGTALAATETDYKVEEKEEIQKTLKFQNPAAPKELIVDNVFGSIRIEGTSGQDVQLLAHKTIKARNKERIQKATEEVELKITEDNNTIELYVDGPFRCDSEERRGINWRDPGYQVHYDFEIKVPRKTNIALKTVTEGNIEVRNIEGEFEVKNVNGRIEMAEMTGGGSAHTVNGGVRAVFNRNPDTDCSFKTINGDLEVTFRENLAADFQLKTFNGDAYSDFPFIYLPGKVSTAERKDGKYVFKSTRFVQVRVGQGGPEIKLDTFNGDILIHRI